MSGGSPKVGDLVSLHRGGRYLRWMNNPHPAVIDKVHNDGRTVDLRWGTDEDNSKWQRSQNGVCWVPCRQPDFELGVWCVEMPCTP